MHASSCSCGITAAHPVTLCPLVPDLSGSVKVIRHGHAICAQQVIHPSLLTSLFLPPVLFAGAYALPRRILIRNASHIALLGVVAVLTGTGMTAVAVKCVLPYSWSWPQALLFGAIAAATDPVAAVALLKEVNTLAKYSKRTHSDGVSRREEWFSAACHHTRPSLHP